MPQTRITSDVVRVGDILQGNKSKRIFVVTFVGLKDIVVRGENFVTRKKYRHASFKGFTNLSAKVRNTAARAQLS